MGMQQLGGYFLRECRIIIRALSIKTGTCLLTLEVAYLVTRNNFITVSLSGLT